MPSLSVKEILDANLDDWRLLAQGLHARFSTGDFLAGVRFVSQLAEAAEAANHHPDVTLTYPHVDIKLISHDVGQVTDRDLDLAREISAIASAAGIASTPETLSQFELALDTADRELVGPVWAALLTGNPDVLDGDDIVDPGGRSPNLWFQSTDSRAQERQRFHIDLWVPHDQMQNRIETAVAAGGRIVDEAPSFVVIADAEGNKACVCSCINR
ncbi:MAG: 4a-hydroxytetrahydrobiopterin dehydratase [Antricoccus sp.]